MHFNLQFLVLVDHTAHRAKYRKTHLYAVAPLKTEVLCFGDTFASFALGGLRFGFSIDTISGFRDVQKLVVEQNGVPLSFFRWPFPRIEHFKRLPSARP